MLVLGLVLIALSAGLVVAVIASGTDDHAMLYGGSIEVSTLTVFLAGAATVLVLVVGLLLVRVGLRRASQNRKNTRRLRRLERRQATSPAGSTPTPPAAPTASAAPGDPAGTVSPPSAPRGDEPYQQPPTVR